MLEAAQHDERPTSHLTRCSVCHATYTNASYAPYWQLSWLGAMWITCCVGVGVMLWSGFTVLDKGSSYDPSVDYLSRAWWTFQFTHATWCSVRCPPGPGAGVRHREFLLMTCDVCVYAC